MRIGGWVIGILAIVGLAGGAAATEIPGGSYWEITYDIGDSTLDASTALGPIADLDLGPGTMILQWNGTDDARLSFFQLDANFDVSGIFVDIAITMGGDANGTLDREFGRIVWSTPADQFNYFGTRTCNGGEVICLLAGLPEGVTVPVDYTVDEFVGDGQFFIDGILMSWMMQFPEFISGSTFTVNVIGIETSRIFVPEPAVPSIHPVALYTLLPSLLVGAGLLGLRRRNSSRE